MTRNQILGVGMAGLLSVSLFALACGSSESIPMSTRTGGTTTPGTGGTGVGPVGDASTSGDGGTPLCHPTQIKGATCETDGFVCRKNCGPTNSGGLKTETCVDGIFVEGSCAFPPGDYTCYQVTSATPECTAVNGGRTVKATDPCDLAIIGTCKPCTGYQDSTGAPKEGYCHCYLNPIQSTTTDAGPNIPRWTCGSVGKEWPCNPDGLPRSPNGTGCI